MNKLRRLALPLIASLAAVGLAVLAIVWFSTDTTLEFRLQDAVSGRWVFDATIKVEDRVIRGFYQADSGDFVYRFTGLKPGEAMLEVSAPGYGGESRKLRLRRGRNSLPAPLVLRGLSIPDLQRFFIFERFEGNDIVCELRPVGSGGKAILNHPCIDLWIGCRVSVQLTTGLPSTTEAETGATRGRELYGGEADWAWDAAPETQFRYFATIPGARVLDDPSAYRIIDYLIVAPKPEVISRAELGTLMGRIFALGDREAIMVALEKEKDRMSWFEDMSTNVPARPE